MSSLSSTENPDSPNRVARPKKEITIFPSEYGGFRREDGGLNTDCDDKDGRISLMVAALFGVDSMVQHLLEKRAFFNGFHPSVLTQFSLAMEHQHDFDAILPPDGPDRERELELVLGRTPLTCAAQGGSEAVVRLLVENNEDVNERDAEGGRAPLHWAAGCGHEQIVELLLQRGADIEVVDHDGKTPLCVAAQVCQAATVDVFLKHNANTHATDRDGHTPLALAVKADRKPSPEEPGISGRKVIQRLIEQGSDIEVRGKNGHAPLYSAALSSNVECMEQLLDCGADTEARSSHGDTALSVAVTIGNWEMVKLLVDRNAKVNARDEQGLAPLDLAVRPGDIRVRLFFGVAEGNKRRIVEFLLDHKADLFTRGGTLDITPIGCAIACGNLEFVKLLLDRQGGVDIEQGPMRFSLLCHAVYQRKEAVVQFLVERGGYLQGKDGRYGRNALSWAASRGNKAVFDRLLKTEIGWNEEDRMCRTALFHAAVAGDKDFFQQLSQLGSDVHQRDVFGLTPLFMAVLYGHGDLVRMILSNHPLKQEPRDRYGRSLSWWMQATDNTWIEDLLTSYGMQLQVSQRSQDKPHHGAVSRNAQKMCDVCTLPLSREHRGVEFGSGCEKYRICQVCCESGASCEDFRKRQGRD